MNDLTIIKIRYDGKEAVSHELDLASLGESLGGIARIISTCAHFAATGEYAKQQPAMAVKVLAREPVANCYSLDAVIQFAQQQQLLAGGISAIVTAVISWVIAKNSGRLEEMKLLKDSLDKAIAALSQRDEALHLRLLGTIEKMADNLAPAVRSAVAPIGKHCTTLTIGTSKPLDEDDKARIMSPARVEIAAEQSWSILITDLDVLTQNGKASLIVDGAEITERIKIKVSDPAVALPGNAYSRSLHERQPITVRAKAVTEDGELKTLHISDS